MLKYQELRRQVELQGQEKTASLLTEALQSKELKAEDFSIRALAEAFCGREWVDACRPGAGTLLTETSAVNTAAFANITGQIVYSAMLEPYQNPAFIGDQLMPTVPTEFKSEKIPGVTRIGDMAEVVAEGKEYPYVGVSEDWIETAETKKRGFIIPITKEAIFFDRTGMVLQHARMLGQDFGINKEKRQLSVALGGTNTYKWKGTTYNTYQTSTPWINSHSNALVDYTDVENAMKLLYAMRDPYTGEPIIVGADTIVVPPALEMTAKRILNAVEVQQVDNQANASTFRTVSNNPLAGTRLRIVTSEWVKVTTSSDTAWYLGNFRRAFAYYQNWPMTVTQAPVNSEEEFTRDILYRFKVSERGVPNVIDPRYVTKN